MYFGKLDTILLRKVLCNAFIIRIGEDIMYHCTGPRIHVSNTGEIDYFQLINEYKYNEISKKYNLVGIVGSERHLNVNDLNRLIL